MSRSGEKKERQLIANYRRILSAELATVCKWKHTYMYIHVGMNYWNICGIRLFEQWHVNALPVYQFCFVYLDSDSVS